MYYKLSIFSVFFILFRFVIKMTKYANYCTRVCVAGCCLKKALKKHGRCQLRLVMTTTNQQEMCFPF
ncbi:hypothetical protein ABFS83_03G086300 [Erythranthe nasuta]